MKMVGKTYQDVAYAVLSQFDFGVTNVQLRKIIDEAYGEQWHHPHVTPVKHIADNLHSLHL